MLQCLFCKPCFVPTASELHRDQKDDFIVKKMQPW